MPKPLETPQSGVSGAALRDALRRIAAQPGWTAARLQAHGLLALTDWAALPTWPSTAPAARAARQALLARELLHRHWLECMDAALRAAGVAALLIKGEALALSGVYPAAGLRERHDIDVWIAPSDRTATERVLRELGGVPQLAAYGHWIQPEQLWRLHSGSAVVGIDLHWQFCSRPALLAALPLTDVLARARPWGSGRGGLYLPADGDALLLAAIHRRAHHRDGERWIWLLDLLLLWTRLDAPAQSAALARAQAGRVASLLWHALLEVEQLQPGSVTAQTLALLADAGAAEPSRHLLLSPQRYGDLRFDLRHARGWQRLQVLRDYTLPPPAYLRQRFADARVRWLPWLYLRRLLRLP